MENVIIESEEILECYLLGGRWTQTRKFIKYVRVSQF